MKHKIWKFEIPLQDKKAQMPAGAQILSVGVQGDEIMVWAVCNPNHPFVTRYFPIFGTGFEMNLQDRGRPFLGTVFQGPYVWHVFDGGEGKAP